jgi:dienelactone hydrolase
MPLKTRKAFVSILLIGLALAAVVALLTVYYVVQGVNFPRQRGQYKVGKTLFEMVDESRPETFSNAGDMRDIVLTIYYPANVAPGDKPSPYVQGKLAEVMARMAGIPRILLNTFHSQCYDGAAAASSNDPFPVLLFSQGFAGQLPWYSALLEEVASHGYVIICISHPYTDLYSVYPDGRVVYMNGPGGGDLQYADTHPELFPDRKTYDAAVETILKVWTDDTIFILDRLKDMNARHDILAGKLDLASVGIFGHSFGGSTAIDAMHRNSSIKAGINLEGAILGNAVTQGIEKPLLIIETPTMAPRDLAFSGNLQKILAMSEHSYIMVIKGAGHISFMPDVAFLKMKYGPLVRQDVGAMDPERSFDIIASSIVQFFDQELKGIPAALFEEANVSVFSEMRKYPEVTIKSYSRN